MSVKSIKATINGQQVQLTYNQGTGYWEASTSAPSTTSWKEQDHKYGIQLDAYDDAGNKTTIDRTDSQFGSNLQLRVLEKLFLSFLYKALLKGLSLRVPLLLLNGQSQMKALESIRALSPSRLTVMGQLQKAFLQKTQTMGILAVIPHPSHCLKALIQLDSMYLIMMGMLLLKLW